MTGSSDAGLGASALLKTNASIPATASCARMLVARRQIQHFPQFDPLILLQEHKPKSVDLNGLCTGFLVYWNDAQIKWS